MSRAGRDPLEAARAGRLSRGDVKRLGAALDEDAALRARVLAGLGEAGADEDGAPLPGKKLLRLWLGRAEGARVRTNPVHRDEAFVCIACGAAVEPGGRPVRDHCPRCLCSLHVDLVPGDRANPCGGVLRPVGLAAKDGEYDIVYRCERCRAEHRNRVHPTDDGAVLRAVAATAASGG